MNTTRNIFSRKTITGLITAASLSAMLVATATPASAEYYHRRGSSWHNGGAIAAGVIGALAIGALASRNYNSYQPAPVYGAPAYYDGPVCHLERQATYDAWGNFVGNGRVRVCE